CASGGFYQDGAYYTVGYFDLW
nr:immunoglobulin heavy chain junction region [Macaca mulatta]MOW45566.1 immunoglobulin heavy chain junction region [Macaca mulatta]MOW45801.1 immunoglobulin heavy chain junction region [Macaca mulatta]MOW45822.1 immunoglobulin heavy chain junction region [Macaca mulatta]MOW46044.1 immunoglobulin heavy chain junction region [Macaca mulatta]